MMKIGLCVCLLLFAINCHSQEKTDKLPTYFGIQVKPVFPSNFVGGKTFSIQEDGFESSITQRLGFGFGGTVRISITKRLAFETGLNFIQRNFDLSVAVADSTIFAENSMTFVEYDIPLNALVYIQLAEKLYMNAALGLSITYKPTNVFTQIRPSGDHYFEFYGLRKNRFGLGLNASFGFEYRTEKKGFFYVGGSARVPFAPLFDYVAHYEYGANSTNLRMKTNGSFLSVDLKYFFPLIKNKGTQFLNGPIE